MRARLHTQSVSGWFLILGICLLATDEEEEDDDSIGESGETDLPDLNNGIEIGGIDGAEDELGGFEEGLTNGDEPGDAVDGAPEEEPLLAAAAVAAAGSTTRNSM
jgi:hypothetical protein